MITPVTAPIGAVVMRPRQSPGGRASVLKTPIPWTVRQWVRTRSGGPLVLLTEPGGFGCWFTPLQVGEGVTVEWRAGVV